MMALRIEYVQIQIRLFRLNQLEAYLVRLGIDLNLPFKDFPIADKPAKEFTVSLLTQKGKFLFRARVHASMIRAKLPTA